MLKKKEGAVNDGTLFVWNIVFQLNVLSAACERLRSNIGYPHALPS
jgi:hypothetical protein